MSKRAALRRDDALYERLAQHAGLPFVRLMLEDVDLDAARRLAPATARALGIVPIARRAFHLVVATADPSNAAAADTVRALTGAQPELVVATAEAIARVQVHVYGPRTHGALPSRPASSLPERTNRRRSLDLARHAELEFVSLDISGSGADPVNPTAAQLLTEVQCRRLRVLPFAAADGELTLALADPFDDLALRFVAAVTGRHIVPVVSPEAEIQRAIGRAFAPLRAAGPPGLDNEARRAQLIGELLVDTGLVTRQQVAEALAFQRRAGGRLGEILLHTGGLRERELAVALAEQLRLPELDVTEFEPEPEALRLVPEAIARRHRFLPLVVRDHVLFLAMTDPLDDDALAVLREHTMLPVRAIVTSRSAMDALLQRVYRGRYVRVATTELLNRSPDESAYRVLSRGQAVALVLIALLFGLSLIHDPIGTIIVFNLASVVFYTAFSLYKFKLIVDALQSEFELPVTREDVDALDERTLPIYTILVPLYREANVVHTLVNAIARLDYPRTKLDVKLICEEDDRETIEALRTRNLPPHFKLVVVPDAHPKTKPKACSYGLIQAEGRYVVIYDAEDRPEVDQLQKIVAAFRMAEDRIVCIQCKLNYYNRTQNVLTRWFTAEYSHWFDLLMPALDATDAPIPLGGTSNHFIAEKLVELGAWDPFNVTEDADLGVRLHKAGYKTAIIDSTTFEEANSDLYNWIRQRSRWVKGYIQTWLVHMRHPVRLLRQIGWRSWLSFQFIVGGTFLGFVLNPVYWVLTTMWVLTQAHVIQQVFPAFVYYAGAIGLIVGNFVFTYINVAGCLRRGHFDLVKYALLSPLYWALMSVGAWKGLLQLVYRPYYWEKTVHGLDIGAAPTNEATGT